MPHVLKMDKGALEMFLLFPLISWSLVVDVILLGLYREFRATLFSGCVTSWL